MEKKTISILALALIFLVVCCKKKEQYSLSGCLTPEKQNRVLQGVVRYSGKLSPEATHETKFNPEFNWYYDKAVEECEIIYCDLNVHDSTYSLLVAREARSITPMKEGIALRIKFNETQGFETYNEVFRMWKMPMDTLRVRGKFLFDRMVKGEDLSLYYATFQQDRFIEYPNDRFKFDAHSRRWKDLELDSITF